MSAGSRLQGRLGQRQTLVPAIQQTLHILRLPMGDLDLLLRDVAEANPFLLYTPPRSISPEAPPMDFAAPETLSSHLREQLVTMGLPRRVRQLAEALTGDLNEDGYLVSTDLELADALQVPQSEIAQAVAALQACDPAGIAARDLRDCLYLQLKARGLPDQTALLATQHLEAIAQHRWRKLKPVLKMDETQLAALAALIRDLSPAPAAQVVPESPPEMPELQVERDDQGRFIVTRQADALSVALDTRLLGDVAPGHDQLAPLRQEARSLMRAVSYRQSTLLQIASAIVTFQQPFFTDGDMAMRPLTRQALADSLNLHSSTVGRAVAGKALTYAGRVLPLSAFLTKSLANDHSAFAVQRRIHRLIDAESADAPLSDDEIAALLRIEGVDIARRTVAKYRGCMSIPSSYDRKRRMSFR